MAYNEQLVVEKLRKLTNLQDSIQVTSNWIIHHRRNFRESLATWFRELNLAPIHNALNLMYLANDVLQNSRKRSPEFIDEFSKYLPDAYSYLFSLAPPDIKQRLARLVEIWETRNIFSPEYCNRLREFAKAADPTAFQQTAPTASSSKLFNPSGSSVSLHSSNSSLHASRHSLFKLIEESELIRANAQKVKEFLDLPTVPNSEQFKASFQSASKILDSLIERQSQFVHSLQQEMDKESEALQQYRHFKNEFQERLHSLASASAPRSTPSPPPYQSTTSGSHQPAITVQHEPLPPAQLELLSSLLNNSPAIPSPSSTTHS